MKPARKHWENCRECGAAMRVTDACPRCSSIGDRWIPTGDDEKDYPLRAGELKVGCTYVDDEGELLIVKDAEIDGVRAHLVCGLDHMEFCDVHGFIRRFREDDFTGLSTDEIPELTWFKYEDKRPWRFRNATQTERTLARCIQLSEAQKKPG